MATNPENLKGGQVVILQEELMLSKLRGRKFP